MAELSSKSYTAGHPAEFTDDLSIESGFDVDLSYIPPQSLLRSSDGFLTDNGEGGYSMTIYYDPNFVESQEDQ